MVEIRRPVQTTQTSIKILKTLIEKNSSTIKELAEELEIAESTTHRHLTTLRNENLVVKINDQYRAGLYLYFLGNKERKQRDLLSAGREVVENLSVQTRKTSWLYSLENDMCAPIYGSSNQTSKNHYSDIGQLTPLHSNAGGKAIMSVLPDDRIDEILRDNRLQPSTEHTITSEARLRDEIEITRDRGYAISEGEAVSGVNAIAAPIAVADEIGAVGFHSFDGANHDDLSVFSEDVLEKAAEISISLQS